MENELESLKARMAERYRHAQEISQEIRNLRRKRAAIWASAHTDERLIRELEKGQKNDEPV